MSLINIYLYLNRFIHTYRLIKISNVDLESRVMVGGMKTESGTDRTIPIHSKIYHLVEEKYKQALSINSNYLINIMFL